MGFLDRLFGRDAGNAAPAPLDHEARLSRLRGRSIASEFPPALRPGPDQPGISKSGGRQPAPRPVALARKPRERGRDWTQDRSWFGGLPKLGGAPWPRGEDGVPLPFAAQIDLAQLAQACPESPLPRDGWLAFFLGKGAVIHVPDGEPAPTPAPEDLPPAYEESGYPLPERVSRRSHQLFPFWPVELIGLPLPEDMRDYADWERQDEIRSAQHELLAERVPTRSYAFSLHSAREAGIEGADLLWWYAAKHVQRALHDALDGVERAVAVREKGIGEARDYQARLASTYPVDEEKIAASRRGEQLDRDAIPDIRRQAAGLEAFLADYDRFTAGKEDWAPMSGEDIATLTELVLEAKKEFRALTRYHVPSRMDDLADLCIRRMITGGEDALAALPDPLLAFINENYRLPPENPHLMLGLGQHLQDDLHHHEGHLLLLQLSYDDMNEWRFGDVGLWHFWISHDDAAARRWDKAKLTFESG